jgi:hypothetical protein
LVVSFATFANKHSLYYIFRIIIAVLKYQAKVEKAAKVKKAAKVEKASGNKRKQQNEGGKKKKKN